MNRRYLVAVLRVIALVVLVPVASAGQGTTSGWTQPQTAWGDPDLQGTYTNKTITPLQRPEELAGREFLTEEEAASLEREAVDRNERLLRQAAQRTEVGGNVGAYNNFWMDRGTRPTGRTSLIVDPPDGKIPPLTPEAQRREAARAEALRARGPADSWEDLELNDRCLVWSAGPPMLPSAYNNNFMILQTPGYVAIQVEMIHDTRIIPLDGRPHLTPGIRQWLGDMRGHWEGDTLVVETTNLVRTQANAAAVGGDPILLRAANGRSDDTVRVIEWFTRVDADTINYEFTIDDPTQWTRSFSRRVSVYENRGSALRVRVSRGELRDDEHPRWGSRAGESCRGSRDGFEMSSGTLRPRFTQRSPAIVQNWFKKLKARVPVP